VKSLKQVILACQKQDSIAQQYLYDQYKGLIFAICKRYVKDTQDAEDVFIEAFYKILSKISMYEGKGSFEGWMKRIAINESLMFLRKRHNFNLSLEGDEIDVPFHESIVSDINFKALLELMDTLPTGYRTVLNMYVIEGYKHREIAEILGISINTSKSQLIAAKKKFALLIKKKQYRAG